MYNARNIRISDGCIYTQIRKGLGMHLVTYANCDTVVKLYIFDRVEIVHDRAMAICVIALNRDVSGKSHCIEIISHLFSILSSVESASIPCPGSIRRYQ